MFVECASCHGSQPNTVNGGPHGMHPVGQAWVQAHGDTVGEGGNASQCTACHGADYRGTVLSRAKGDRTLSGEFGSKQVWRGFQIGCYTCHRGPGNSDPNPNRPAVVTDATVATPAGTPITVTLQAHDPDGNPLTLRIVSQPARGTVGLSGSLATYIPEQGFQGADPFTFAAWDGSTDSNLGTVTVDVGGAPGCTYGLTPAARTFGPGGGSDSVSVATAPGCPWTASSDMPWLTVTSAGAGGGDGAVGYAVAPNTSSAARTGTLAIGSATFTVTEAGLGGTGADLTVQWLGLTERCIGADENIRCRLRGKVLVVNQGSAQARPSLLRFYRSATPAADGGATLLKEAKIPSRRAGQSRKKGLGLRLPGGSAAGQYVIAVVDATNAVAETDETNNTASFGPLP